MADVLFDIQVPVGSALTLTGDLVVEGAISVDFSRGVVTGTFHAVSNELIDLSATPIAQVGASTGSTAAQIAAANSPAPGVAAPVVQPAPQAPINDRGDVSAG